MSNQTPITRQQIAAALAAARAKVADDKRWFNALSKAAMELEASKWIWYANVSTLKVASRTTEGTWYTVDNGGCQCPAARKNNPCWHAAARRLIQRASEVTAPAAPPVATISQAQQEADELFN